MQYIVAVEERRPDCWMVLPPRRGGPRTVAGAWRALPAAGCRHAWEAGGGLVAWRLAEPRRRGLGAGGRGRGVRWPDGGEGRDRGGGRRGSAAAAGAFS